MKNNFAEISEKVDQATLIKNLILKGCHFLSNQDLAKIVNHDYKMLNQHGEVIFEGLVYEIPDLKVTLVQDSFEFAQKATLKGSGYRHSWAENSFSKDFGDWVLGIGDFGSEILIEFSRNGELEQDEENHAKVEFDFSRPQVILVLHYHTDKDDEFELIVFKPGREIKISPEIKYIMDNFLR